jgi:hypothetical protein
MAIKKIIKMAKEIIKPKKEKPLELKKEQSKEIKSETVSENTSSLTRETN